MITDYYRPQTLDEALKLISRPNTFPLGGGSVLNQPSDLKFAVVDLQALDLSRIHKQGNNLEIGATATLQQLLDSPHTPEALKITIKLETSFNIRQMGSVAGTLVACDGRSPFTTAMLALDGKLNVDGGPKTEVGQASTVIGLSDLFAFRNEVLPHKLITKIIIPLNVKLAFESVARSPMDRPIVCAAVAQWISGRTRLALGGYGKVPLLAMDGTEPAGLDSAARNAFHEATDEWASAEYRMDVAATLAKRCTENLRK